MVNQNNATTVTGQEKLMEKIAKNVVAQELVGMSLIDIPEWMCYFMLAVSA